MKYNIEARRNFNQEGIHIERIRNLFYMEIGGCVDNFSKAEAKSP